ncbi:505_t:CDS:1, partial [Funneliformis geosporum]
MLSNNEWELLSKLVDILEGFEKVTVLLGGAKYITISLMYPAISRIILEIKPRNEPSPCIIETEDEFDDIDQITILENMEE